MKITKRMLKHLIQETMKEAGPGHAGPEDRFKLKPPSERAEVDMKPKAKKSLADRIKEARSRLGREKKRGDKKRIASAERALSKLQAQLTKENVNEGMPGEEGGLAKQVASLAARITAIEKKMGGGKPSEGDDVTLEENIASMIESY